MSETVLVALISASAALIVGLTSVGLNVFWMGRSFDQLRTTISDMRGDMNQMRGDMSQMRGDMNKRFDRIDLRLDHVEDDLKQFYRMLSEHSTDIARLKDKTDMN